MPRVCGDEPIESYDGEGIGLPCPAYAGMNPQQRGRVWVNDGLCPAYAGMNPTLLAKASAAASLCPAYAGMNPRNVATVTPAADPTRPRGRPKAPAPPPIQGARPARC